MHSLQGQAPKRNRQNGCGSVVQDEALHRQVRCDKRVYKKLLNLRSLSHHLLYLRGENRQSNVVGVTPLPGSTSEDVSQFGEQRHVGSWPNVQGHPPLPVARPMTGAKRLSMGRDTGSRWVHRLVRFVDSLEADF